MPRAVPISITTDVIVGFPGESEKDFEDSISLLESVGYDGVYAFTYSPRPNTPASSMLDAVPEAEKSRRLAVLQERQRQIQAERNSALVGQVFEVLVDGRHAARNQWAGRSSSNRVLNFTSPRENLLGEYVQVHVTRAAPYSLFGEHAI